jgi:Flp pilus assembly protein TadG
MGQQDLGFLARLRRDDRGVMSAFLLFMFIAICCVGAVALDVNHMYAAREQLQVTADATAHAAIY